MKRQRWVICPLCGCGYDGHPGMECDDLSHGQSVPCGGLCVSPEEYESLVQMKAAFRADWEALDRGKGASINVNERTVTRFYKDGDSMAVSTTAESDEQFVRDAVEAVAQMIEERRFDGDWEFQLSRWIPQIIDISCKLRGYKANVVEKRLIVAGGWAPDEEQVIAIGAHLPTPKPKEMAPV